MMQAGESGTAQRQRATSELSGQASKGIDQGIALGRLGASAAQAGMQDTQQTEARQSREKIARGAELMESRRMDLAEESAGFKARGAPKTPLGEDSESREGKLRSEMDKGTAGDRPLPHPEGGGGVTEQDRLEARSPMQTQDDLGQGGGPEVSQRDPEQVARLQAQGGKPIEIGGQGQAVPGQEPQGQGLERSDYGKRQEGRAERDSITRRMAAEGRATTRMQAALKAQLTNNKEALKEIETELDGQVDQQMDIFSSVKNSFQNPQKQPSFSDWKRIQEWAIDMGMKDNPGAGDLMEIIANGVKTRNGPTTPEGQARLEQFISGYQDRTSMQYAMVLGKVPSQMFNFDGAMADEFQTQYKMGATLMQSVGPLASEFGGIRDQAERNRAATRYAARMVLGSPSAQLGSGTYGMKPQLPGSAGGDGGGGQQQQGEQRDLRGELEDTERQSGAMESKYGVNPTDVGSVARAAGRMATPYLGSEQSRRPGAPQTEGGRTHGKSYEYRKPEGGERAVKTDRNRRVYAERREDKFRELAEAGHEEAAADLRQADTEVDVVGETENGVPVLNTIPQNSNPDKWEWTEYGDGEFGWAAISKKKSAKA